MKRRNFFFTALLVTASLGVTPAASAALYSRTGDAMVYDSDLNITWLANANLAASETFGITGINANGSMLSNTANNWLAAMNAANYLGYSDWRLPAITYPNPDGLSGAFYTEPDDLTYGEIRKPRSGNPAYFYNNANGSELGHLFYSEIGASAGNSITSGNPAALAKFSNIQSAKESLDWGGGQWSGDAYWSGTESLLKQDRPSAAAPNGWVFDTSNGGLSTYANLLINAGRAYQLTNIFVWPVRSGDVSNVPLPPSFGYSLAPWQV